MPVEAITRYLHPASLSLPRNPTPQLTPSSKQEFLDKIFGSEDAVVLDAWAEWCPPCKAIAPKVEEFSAQYPQAKFYKVDVDKVPDVAQELGIRAMPTILYFNKGEKISEVVGANLPEIEKGIKALVAA